MILDSNIVIYANSSSGAELREWVGRHRCAVSEITRLEVLGYHRFQNDQRLLLTRFIGGCSLIPVSSIVIDEAIRLRQLRKMDLGDALIAASALVHSEPLGTANIPDFQWIFGLSLVNPLQLLNPPAAFPTEFTMSRVASLVLLAALLGCGGKSAEESDPAPPGSWERAKPTRAGADWPQLLGPNRDGICTETGILKVWPNAGLKKIWDCSIGVGYAPAAVADGKLYQFDRVDDVARCLCRNAETGALLWKYDYATSYRDLYGYDPGPRASPVVDGDQVFLHGVDGFVVALNAANGREQWKVDTKKIYGIHQNFFGAGSVPLVVGELVLVPVGGSPKGARPFDFRDVKGNGSGIVAFDRKTGVEKYKFSDELASYSSPILATFHGQKTALYFGRGGLLGFDPSTGKQRFFHKWRAKLEESVNAANPVVQGERILISECYEKGSLCLEVQNDFTLRVIWSDDEHERGEKSLMAHWCTPIADGPNLYGCSARNSPQADFRCVEFATGKVKWIEPKTRWTTAIRIDGHLLTLAEEGTLTLVKLNPEKYEKIAQWPGDKNPDLEYPCWAPPVVSRGLLYLRGKGKLICYELVEKK